ncbi:MAG: Zn-ribbon domain-containing OB-fold protein [Pseudomonadota bacterium]
MDMDVKLAGTALSEKDIKEGKVLYTEWRPRAMYAWDAGRAMSKFLEGLKNGTIVGTECPKCRRIMLPPRIFCELCYRPTDTWVQLGDKGKVRTFCITRVRWDASRVEEPFFPVVVDLDGGKRGTGLMHVVKGMDPSEMKVGIRVKALWKPPEERIGAITDILHFTRE